MKILNFKSFFFLIILLVGNNVFGQAYLDKTLFDIELYFTMENSNFKRENMPNGEINIVQYSYDENNVLKGFRELKLAKDSDQFRCYKENTFLPYSEQFAATLIAEINQLGYTKTNYLTDRAQDVYLSNDSENHPIKHYISISTIDLGEADYWIVVEYFLKTNELVSK